MSNFPQFNVNNEHQLIRRQNTYVLDRKLITIHSKDRNIVIAEGYIELAFIKKSTKKITRAPDFFIIALKKYFKEK